jgi:hypothetical protein
VTIKEARAQLDQIERENPNADDLVLWEAAKRKKARIESEKVMSFRVPVSLKPGIENLFERIAAKIGSQSKADAWDYLLAETADW